MLSKTVPADSADNQVCQMAPGLDCTFHDGGFDAAWVRVKGELDLATAPLLEQTLRQAEVWARVVLDLRQLAFVDCRGLTVIIQAGIRATQAGRQLVVVRGPAVLDKLLTLVGASAPFQVVDLGPFQPPVQALVELAHPGRAA